MKERLIVLAPALVPVALGRLSLDECRALGEATAAIVRDERSPPLIIASSDMSHYVSDETARGKDKTAIGRVLELDAEGLYETVRRERPPSIHVKELSYSATTRQPGSQGPVTSPRAAGGAASTTANANSVTAIH